MGNSGKTTRACLRLLLQLGDTAARGLTRHGALTPPHKPQQGQGKALHKLFPTLLNGFTPVFSSQGLRGTGDSKLPV